MPIGVIGVIAGTKGPGLAAVKRAA